MISPLYEKLAEIEHQRWADWQKHVHSVCIKNNDGSLTIPKILVDNWNRQINTSYDCLSLDEKESDRAQVDRYFPLLIKMLESELKYDTCDKINGTQYKWNSINQP